MANTRELKTFLDKAIAHENKDPIMVSGAPGLGKCLLQGTPILMFDGTIKFVENVKVGDLLMGPDSKARAVLNVTAGKGEMYTVCPVEGDAYSVNAEHILSLRLSGTNNQDKLVNISVKDYLAKDSDFKHRAKGWRTGVEFDAQEVPLDPYFVGIWLGDGNSCNQDITNSSQDVSNHLLSLANSYNLKVTATQKPDNKASTQTISTGHVTEQLGTSNPLLMGLRNLNLLSNKHIPNAYKFNTAVVRQQLLAGLIDSDGYVVDGCVQITTKYPALADDILFLCRSLGLAAYATKLTKGIKATGFAAEYLQINISGDFKDTPTTRRKIQGSQQVKNVLRTGITVKATGVANYYGFELNGDHLFLLGDFTVTHNSSVIQQVAKAHGLDCIDLRISQITPQDLRGLPVVDKTNNSFEYYPPSFLPREGSKPGVLFLDEITQAPQAVQNVTQQLVLDRRVGEYRFPDNWFIWAGGNRTSDRTSVYSMPTALANRFNHITIEPDFDVWKLDYAVEHIDPAIVAFLAFRPSLLHAISTDSSAWPSPRSWKMADRLYASGTSISPAVGLAAAAEFESFLTLYKDLPNLDLILKGSGSKIVWPKEESVKFATLTGLTQKALTCTGPELVNALKWVANKGTAEYLSKLINDLLELSLAKVPGLTYAIKEAACDVELGSLIGVMRQAQSASTAGFRS